MTIGDGRRLFAEQRGAKSITLKGNTGGVTLVGNTIKGSVKVTGNSGGTTVTGNTIAKNLTR